MLPCNISGHAAYQDFVLTEIFHFYPDPFSLSRDTWEIIIEFWHLDLSLTDSLMMERYSKQGPEPRLPSCMLRSYLLLIKFKITSITRWVAKYGRTVHTQLKDNPRIFNMPPRDSKQWDKEYDRRTSVERSNKREKQDYKLEDGKHRSTKMWYCRRHVYFSYTKISSFLQNCQYSIFNLHWN